MIKSLLTEAFDIGMTLVLTRQMSDPRPGLGAAALAGVHTLGSTSRARVLKHLAKEACDPYRR